MFHRVQSHFAPKPTYMKYFLRHRDALLLQPTRWPQCLAYLSRTRCLPPILVFDCPPKLHSKLLCHNRLPASRLHQSFSIFSLRQRGRQLLTLLVYQNLLFLAALLSSIVSCAMTRWSLSFFAGTARVTACLKSLGFSSAMRVDRELSKLFPLAYVQTLLTLQGKTCVDSGYVLLALPASSRHPCAGRAH